MKKISDIINKINITLPDDIYKYLESIIKIEDYKEFLEKNKLNLNEYVEPTVNIELDVDDIDDTLLLHKKIAEKLIGNGNFFRNGDFLFTEVYDEDSLFANKNSSKKISLLYFNNRYYVITPGAYDICNPNCFVIPLLKKLKIDYPDKNIPSVIASVYKYPFKPFDINYDLKQDLSTSLSCLLSENSVLNYEIFVDKNKNVKLKISGCITDIEKIPIKYETELTNKEEVEKDIEFYEKCVFINSYYKEKRIKIYLDNDKKFIFLYNEKIIDKDNIEKQYLELYNHVIDKRLKELDMLNKKYLEFKNKYNEFLEITNRVKKMELYLKQYQDNQNNMFQRIFNKKFVLEKENIEETSINIDVYSENRLMDFLYDPNIKLNFVFSDIYSLRPTALLNLQYTINKIEEAITYGNKEIQEKLKSVIEKDIYCKDIIEKISHQSIAQKVKSFVSFQIPELDELDFTKKPNIEYNSKNETTAELEKNYKYNEMQIYQRDNLTEEEKMALMIYKLQFYRAFNEIIIGRRNSGCKKDDQQEEKIIKEGYKLLEDAYKMNMMTGFRQGKNKARYTEVVSSERLLSYDEYKKIVYEYLPLVEEAVKKCPLSDNFTLYRAVKTNDYSNLGNGFISTTTNIESTFAYFERQGTEEQILYRINIPKGSPAIIFSTELLTGETDDKNPFIDGDKEILIDSKNYSFVIKNVKIYDDAVVKNKMISLKLVEVDAIPKFLVNENKTQIELNKPIKKKS